MSAFDSCLGVEAKGLAVLLPFLESSAHEGRFIMTTKGRMARHLQETIGDAMFNSDADTVWSVEIKIEEENKYGNLFLETWSNKNLRSKEAHAERGSNPGWMMKLRADLLFYYFLRSDELYILDFYKLKRWAFAHDGNGSRPRIDGFPEKQQGKREQLNDTWGRCVPVAVLSKEPGLLRKVSPRQIDMFDQVA